MLCEVLFNVVGMLPIFIPFQLLLLLLFRMPWGGVSGEILLARPIESLLADSVVLEGDMERFSGISGDPFR